jgi:DNA-binding NtrC family response regulator
MKAVMTKFKILIIDDEKNIRDIFSLLLSERGYLVKTTETGQDGLEVAQKFMPDIALLDMNLPDMSGLDALSLLLDALPNLQIIIITAYGTIKNAVEATKMGAYDYLEKPVDNDELLLLISRALQVRELQLEVATLKSELSSKYRFANIIGMSSLMDSVFQLMGKIAQVDGTVLITGESGTGKELVARAIHFNSPRKENPFVVVNCGAIPRDLIESEFFGHVKGAFTDAKAEKTGKFELAHKGTIFLDEISDLSRDAQVKLLRALGEKEIVKVGGTKTIPVDVRVIAATNKDLEEQVKKGNFREDLYFRLAVLSLHLPPLRERREDILLLCEHFIKKFNRELSKQIKGLSEKTLNYLKNFTWPGNVRELENVIYESMVLCDSDRIDEENLPLRIRHDYLTPDLESGSLKEISQSIASTVERNLIEKALKETGGNKTQAAKSLGISRKTLFNKMRLLKM